MPGLVRGLLPLVTARTAAIAANELPLPPALELDVASWESIFTRYDSSQGVWHDSRYLDIVYEGLEIPAGRIRYQQGLADRFREGLERSGLWRSHVETELSRLGVPPALVALPHVESSYNPGIDRHTLRPGAEIRFPVLAAPGGAG